MSKEFGTNDPNQAAASDDEFERLFKHTKPRVRPADADEQAIRASLHAEWHAVVGRRIWVSRVSWAAAAAVLVLAAAVLVDVRLLDGEPPIVAALDRVEGDIRIALDGEVLSQLAPTPGFAVLGGQSLETADGGAALKLSQGGSLRLGTDTRITFVAAGELELLRGALYFDSQDAGGEPSEALIVRTHLGAVRDVGTQFITRLEPDLLEVSVREGAVAVDRGDAVIDAGIGERLRVPAAGSVARQSIALYGDAWLWAEQLAPAYDIDRRSVFDFLAWVERETGRHVVFTSPEAEAKARLALLRGGSIDLHPMPMLRAVLATTDFSYTVTAGEIAVSAP